VHFFGKGSPSPPEDSSRWGLYQRFIKTEGEEFPPEAIPSSIVVLENLPLKKRRKWGTSAMTYIVTGKGGRLRTVASE